MTSVFDRRASAYPGVKGRDSIMPETLTGQDNLLHPESTTINRRKSTFLGDISRRGSVFPVATNKKDSASPHAPGRKGSIFPDNSSNRGDTFPDTVNRKSSTIYETRRSSIFPETKSRRGSVFPDSKNRRGSIFPEAKNRRGSKFPDPKSIRSSRPPDAKFKVLLLGDMGVGKTSIFFRIKDDDFSHMRNLTLGLDMCVTRVSVGEAEVEISLCDTAGSERYRTLTRNFYRNAQAILFVFSVDNPTSLYGLGKWDEDARMYAPTAARFLVGNKSDLSRAVTEHTMSTFASSHDCEEAFAVSAKTGEGVSDILYQVSSRLLWRHNEAQKDLEASWMDDTVNIYEGEEIPGLKSQMGSGCCR